MVPLTAPAGSGKLRKSRQDTQDTNLHQCFRASVLAGMPEALVFLTGMTKR